MTHVYTLKIRYSGEEDEVYVFSTREKAEAMVYEFFEDTEGKSNLELDDFQEYLFVNDIGFFDIENQKIN